MKHYTAHTYTDDFAFNHHAKEMSKDGWEILTVSYDARVTVGGGTAFSSTGSTHAAGFSSSDSTRIRVMWWKASA